MEIKDEICSKNERIMTNTQNIGRFFLVVIFLFLLNTLIAQQETVRHNVLDTIGFGTHLNAYYLQNQKAGFADIKPLLLQYPSSKTEYFKYKKQNTVSTSLLILADAAAVIAIFKSESFSSYAPYLGGFAGGLAVGIPLSISAKKHFKQGAMLYNKELLK